MNIRPDLLYGDDEEILGFINVNRTGLLQFEKELIIIL